MRAAPDLSTAVWRKSSYSNNEGGVCVEVADEIPGLVPVRDSQRPHGPALLIPDEAWTTFVTGLKTDGFAC
ncbi:DUF397 domain-containing protein [Streptomyces decoyicus]|uniref:DUF397 domain-containing protein n=1 Tax=Streptomyces decoyicus TaxID=249567 RepID=UPI0004AA7C88|nr:DUF397 domain-containing protein [Streptomyces decoyicus]KOG39750.1 hypothetical protein ADK74_27275 [Streptomyces decoyicus]QZY17922.1 DUF397 domain-containing protein [Streptomyces decoyicus]